MTRKVDRLSCIRYASARYSVPTRLIGATVRVLVEGTQLRVIDADGVIAAEHALAAPGTASVIDAHYDRPRPIVPDRGPRRCPATRMSARCHSMRPV